MTTTKKDSDEIPREWTPPQVKSVQPPAGKVAGGEWVKIEFEGNLPDDIADEIGFVKFGEAFAPEFEFKRETPSSVRVMIPESPHGKTGKVGVEIEVSNHRIQSTFEYT